MIEKINLNHTIGGSHNSNYPCNDNVHRTFDAVANNRFDDVCADTSNDVCLGGKYSDDNTIDDVIDDNTIDDVIDDDVIDDDAFDDERATSKIEQKLDSRINTRRKRDLADGFKKNKVVNEVLDKPTIMTLYKMITSGVLSGVNGSISAGKESLVFWGLDSAGMSVALKIYLVSTSNFKRRQEYVLGDPRFTSIKKGTRNMVYLWAKKEFRNLKQCEAAGISAPRPIHVANNVLAMEFIGSSQHRDDSYTMSTPATQLLHSTVNYDDYLQATSIIIDLYEKAGLVHGDYSEYNIFKVDGRGLVVFDLGSAVHKNHPNSTMFLQRDINNIIRFFKKRGVKIDDNDADRIMERLVS